MRKTQKYLAAVNQSKALALRLPSTISNEKLYARLDQEGWWWNGSGWTNEPRRQRYRMEFGSENVSPDLLEIRVIAYPARIRAAVDQVRRLAQVVGWEFLKQSDGYEASGGAAVRVYLTFKMTTTIVTEGDGG